MQKKKMNMLLLISFYLISMTFRLCSSQVLMQPVGYDESILTPRVVAGTPARLGDFPYQLALKSLSMRSRGIYRTFCGAVIIGPSKILTAAHCFVKNRSSCKFCVLPGSISQTKKEATFAVAGNLMNQAKYSDVDSLDGGQWRRVRGVRYPKGYRFPKHDIAVAFTLRPFLFNAHVASIPYARSFVDYRGQCVVSGYGRTGRHATSKRSEVLLSASLDMIPWSVCNRKFRKNMKKFICTSRRVSDIAKGDSGGPLVCPSQNSPGRMVVGIVSGHHARIGSFFTRVSSYYSFIARNNSLKRTKDVSQSINLLCLFLIYRTIRLF